MVAALDLSDSLTLDEGMVLQASQDDPVYQLLKVDRVWGQTLRERERQMG